MALKEYRAKRNFRKTPEPGAARGKRHKQPIFVVQEHHARRLHYDFRLEADGVLKSWAVPKEPTLDPSTKRLAVHVEDHPLSYAGFKGRIPEGQYGAGTVSIWDHGTYENLLEDKPTPLSVTEGIDAGRLEFNLHGKKLNGRFALIRMQVRDKGKDNWLLIKMKDEFAQPDADGKVAEPKKKGKAKAKSPAKPQAAHNGKPAKKEPFSFSHVDKILFPDNGITKGDVLDFYIRIAPRLLPFLRDRPATLERLPEGIGGGKSPHFWQKNTPEYYPKWILRAEFPGKPGETVKYAVINDAETLLYLVNQGALTFHVWFSCIDDLGRPDFVLFDLDPGQATFADAVKIAKHMHALLEDAGRPAYIKTSGKTGLHILVPWEGKGGYAEAREWGLGLARQVVEALPEIATVERSKAKRGRRVYVDLMQNSRGQTVVPPYVLRPVPGAPVSTPIEWHELTPKLDPHNFNLKTIFGRLKRQKRDPLAGLMKTFAGTKATARRP
ncbi:MAG TPA: non-homologous end-joining DNA ligase [Gemmataceae bacterium]|jgi:bifunctional non-homologous end joining protein LigD|nr:non-homologous end-joining DNA ligase [Gemmataceae bacterium]